MDILVSAKNRQEQQYHTEYCKKKLLLLNRLKGEGQSSHTLRLKKKTSNLFRHRHNIQTKWLNLQEFNKVIKVDAQNLIVEVEGLTTYEDLVKVTLNYHCLPAIVPELKSITVGGAIAGLGAESSSFKYGWVHETVTELEVLLAHGEVVVCSPDNAFSDLFYALPGSYGTLGYILKAKIRLMNVKPYIKLTRWHFVNPQAYFDKLAELVSPDPTKLPLDYVDGTILGDDMYITIGSFVEQAPYVSNYKYMHIYYKSIAEKKEDYLTTLDYIWRWDTDWFWCSKYFLMQNYIFRLLLGKFMLRSTIYWKIMHLVNTHPLIKHVANLFGQKMETIIQDLQIPIDHAVDFYQFFKNEIGIDPILIAPLRSSAPSLANFDFCPIEKNKLYVNFGAYGNFIPSNQELGHFNKCIENKVAQCKGNKWLYSNVFYTEQEFWQLFNKQTYLTLKQKYDPQKLLGNLYTKCVEKMV